MNGAFLVRGVVVAVIVYSATMFRPIEGHLVFNITLGVVLSLLIIAAEMRLRDVSVTSVLGALLGGGIGLSIALAINSGLFWVDTGQPFVKFMHTVIFIVLP